MKTSSKIFILLTVTILIALAYFSHAVIKKRYFSGSQVGTVTLENDIQRDTTPTKEDSSPAGPENAGSDQVDDKEEFVPEDQLMTFRDIEKEDCSNGCVDFDSDNEKKYCLQVCDSSPQSTDASENCSDKSGLEKDYCHKDAGIANSNFDECKKITDKNIRRSCTNAITDKILERSESGDQNP